MARIAIDELRAKLKEFFKQVGFTDKDVDTFTELVLEQELIGNAFSAVGELKGKHLRLLQSSVSAREEVEVDKPSAMLVKGNGRSAPLITADYTDTIIAKAKSQGVFAFGLYDSTYNDFFEVFCRRIAAHDLITIITENGGPQGVVAYGGTSDITGTNPLAYGIPTNELPIVFDAATSMHAYGLINQAKKAGSKLPENAYVDKNGDITTDPNDAYAVLPFGGFKGWAINILIDVLSGALVRGRSGLDQPTDSQRYIGTFIIVIDPACFGDIEAFKDSTTKLMNDILAVPAIDLEQPVRTPGLRGGKRMQQALADGFVEIADEDWQKFIA